MKKPKLPKARNPFVQHLLGKNRIHGKTYKAQRRDEKITVKNAIKSDS